jgi:hypothetical protein
MRHYIFFLGFIVIACSNSNDPSRIIDKAIEVHGGEKFTESRIEFDFRGRHYVAERKKGLFSYERIFKDSTDIIHDFLTNDGFRREINGTIVNVVDSMAAKYTRSVNSTIYFACLPYGLNDDAVKKKLLGETIIDKEPYYKIEVTFESKGGGEDFNDVFHYWIHQKNYTMDYLSYLYYTDEGGIRFRKAIKKHKVGGLILQDYINYQPQDSLATLDMMEELYKQNKLVELSKIEITNVVVKENTIFL